MGKQLYNKDGAALVYLPRPVWYRGNINLAILYSEQRCLKW